MNYLRTLTWTIDQRGNGQNKEIKNNMALAGDHPEPICDLLEVNRSGFSKDM